MILPNQSVQSAEAMENNKQTNGIINMCPFFAIIINGERCYADQEDDKGVGEEFPKGSETVFTEKISLLNTF